jgi:uncharacterized zinc-type alcohol dehydrogenase-like protein
MTGTYDGYERYGKTIAQGGYSTGIVIDAEYVVSVPENLKLSGVALLLCAGITLYSPLKHWALKLPCFLTQQIKKLTRREWVLIISL